MFVKKETEGDNNEAMQQYISVLCFIATCTATKAWYNKFDNAVYGGWAPNRRSMVGCIETGGRCIKNYQCCESGDTCMIENGSKLGFGICKPRYQVLDAYLPHTKFGNKKRGQECVDSSECEDQCCRPFRMGRMGTRLTCGKPEDNTACVGRVFSINDIYGNY